MTLVSGHTATIAKCDESHRPAPLTEGTVSETLAGHEIRGKAQRIGKELDGRLENVTAYRSSPTGYE